MSSSQTTQPAALRAKGILVQVQVTGAVLKRHPLQLMAATTTAARPPVAMAAIHRVPRMLQAEMAPLLTAADSVFSRWRWGMTG